MHTNLPLEMGMWERQAQSLRYKGPSFSSSLLDAIYHSIDETPMNFDHPRRRNNVEDDIESLRRAIMIEKWITNSTSSQSHTHSPAPSPKPNPKRTKTKAQKIYGELKKVKEPISPGGKISNFLNSIFSSKNLVKTSDQEWSSMRKSRSMKDNATCPSLASRSCLSKNASSGGSKSKRSVRFCPVSVILDEESKPCGHKSIYDDDEDDDECVINPSGPSIGCKKNMEGGKNLRKYYSNEYDDFDNMSCGSSDLFELEELPVYGTTRIEINRVVM